MLQVSIIIPVYNCEDYIETCISSVQKQSLKELEMICIDDGSTDGSAKVIRRMAEADQRIILLEQSNQGAGRARNYGIRKARGKYLAFLDADDYYLDFDALKKMVKLCEEKQVHICGSLRKCLESGKEKTECLFQKIKSETNKELEKCIYKYHDFQMDYDYQSFLFDREMLIQNSVMFPDYRRFQDPPFMVKAMYCAERFVIADTYLYCYRKSEMAGRFTEAKTIDLLKGLLDNLKFADEHNLAKLFSMTQERLEYEYAGIIYHNISGNESPITALLLEADRIINQKKGTTDDMIRPLKKFREEGFYNAEVYEEKLLLQFEGNEQFALYGAGKYARAFLHYLEQKNVKEKIKTIVVTSITDNAADLSGIPLIPITEFSGRKEKILVALGANFHKEIENTLRAEKIDHYQLIDDVFLSGLFRRTEIER